MSIIDVAQLQARLEKTFNENGIIGPRLDRVASYETSYGEYIKNKFNGYFLLVSSFQSFFYDTLSTASTLYRDPLITKHAPYQPLYLLNLLTAFRSIRATENLLYNGYPLDGLSLLRDIKDRAIFFAAWISGLTNWKSLNAPLLVPTKADAPVQETQLWRRAREKEENRVLKLILREDSDFEEPIKSELKVWETFFNLEVHGSLLTFASEFGDWMKNIGQLSIPPVPIERSIASYTCRAIEVFWMVHRTLPFIQLTPNCLGSDWAEKWMVLDESFRQHQTALFEGGVKIAKSFEVFIDRKFPFNPATIYVERDEPMSTRNSETD